MLKADFDRSMDEMLLRCKTLLSGKGEEYAINSTPQVAPDRLIAFKKAGGLQGVTPECALVGMLTKHLVSIADMSREPNKYSADRWNEKICDSINYLLLLNGLLTERRDNNE